MEGVAQPVLWQPAVPFTNPFHPPPSLPSLLLPIPPTPLAVILLTSSNPVILYTHTHTTLPPSISTGAMALCAIPSSMPPFPLRQSIPNLQTSFRK